MRGNCEICGIKDELYWDANGEWACQECAIDTLYLLEAHEDDSPNEEPLELEEFDPNEVPF